MSRPALSARLIATLAGMLVALALFAYSLTGLAGLDGRLETAVSAEQSPGAFPVKLEQRERGCPHDDRRLREDRLRF